jgi:hypothetical protein
MSQQSQQSHNKAAAKSTKPQQSQQSHNKVNKAPSKSTKPQQGHSNVAVKAQLGDQYTNFDVKRGSIYLPDPCLR